MQRRSQGRRRSVRVLGASRVLPEPRRCFAFGKEDDGNDSLIHWQGKIDRAPLSGADERPLAADRYEVSFHLGVFHQQLSLPEHRANCAIKRENVKKDSEHVHIAMNYTLISRFYRSSTALYTWINWYPDLAKSSRPPNESNMVERGMNLSSRREFSVRYWHFWPKDIHLPFLPWMSSSWLSCGRARRKFFWIRASSKRGVRYGIWHRRKRRKKV